MRLLLFFLLLPLLGEGYPPPLDEGADPLPEVYPEKMGALSFSTFMPKGEEFLVNEEGYPGGFPQWYPDIVPLSDNGFVVVWMDERNGYYDIYAQRFGQEGNLLGENFKANDDLERACQRYQAAAWGKGRFCICWRDMWDGLVQVYAQTWDSSGQPQESNFKPTRKVWGAHQFSPSLASEPEGLTLVAWEDYREGRAKIYGQWINGEGFSIEKNFPIQDRAWSCQQLSP